MRDICENVWARRTLRDLDAEPIVASIGFKWFSEDHKLHYSGPVSVHEPLRGEPLMNANRR